MHTNLERDIPMLGPRIPAETLRWFWTMLAHSQGQLWNASVLARSRGVDGKTVMRAAAAADGLSISEWMRMAFRRALDGGRRLQ